MMNRRSAILLMGVGATSAAIPIHLSRAEVPDSDGPLFRGNFETGNLDQYASTELSGGRLRPEIISAPTQSDQSKFACEYKLSGSQFRCENVPAYGRQRYVATEGSDLYYGWSINFPQDFPEAPWQVCGQWHQTNFGGSGQFDNVPPPMAFYVAGGDQRSRWRLANNGQNPWRVGWSIDLGEVPRGEWTDIIVHARFSTIPEYCIVEVWLNGVQIGSLIPPVPTLYPTETSAERVSYFKIGYYRDPGTETPGSVIYDNVLIGTNYTSVTTT